MAAVTPEPPGLLPGAVEMTAVGVLHVKHREANERLREDTKFLTLCELDKSRKRFMTIGDELGWKIIFALEGTILPALLREPLLHVSVAVYVVLRSLVFWDVIQVEEGVEFQGVTMLGGAVTFFLVFYAGHTFTRFQQQYFVTMEAGQALHSFAMLARGYLCRERALRVIRRANAAHVLAYVGLSTTYEIDFLRGFNRRYQIMTRAEMKVIEPLEIDKANSDEAFSLVVQWIIEDLAEAVPLREASELKAREMTVQIVTFKEKLKRLYHYRDQRMPFIYVHLAVVLGYVYLPLLAVVLAMAPKGRYLLAGVLWEFQNWSALMFSCAFVLGLRETAQLMSDPFGHDEYDFPVIEFSIQSLRKCRKLMDRPRPPKVDRQVEEGLLIYR